ncbi:MAG: MBL fold metallo-hydrolase [Candidatus Paceibacterota bacterium]|jgi:L-ascorbate metabolism protein UlaG (beta-lactamase superfamily)
MKLTKFEQSGFIFETEKGFRLAVDIGNKTPVGELDNIKVDAMIVSHIHGDHFSLDQIKKLSPKKLYISNECKETINEDILPVEIVVIKADSQINIEDIIVDIFNSDHGPNVSTPLKENLGFLFTIDNQKIYFPGDMFYTSGIDVTNLEVDYALLPIGTFYTFGPQEAFDFAKTFKKIGKIISMHDRKTPGLREQFLDLAKGNFIAE